VNLNRQCGAVVLDRDPSFLFIDVHLHKTKEKTESAFNPLPLWKKHSKNSQQAKTPRKGQKRFFSALPPASLFPKCLQRFGLDVGHVIWIALKVITGIHQDLIKDFVEAGNEVDLRIPFDAARG